MKTRSIFFFIYILFAAFFSFFAYTACTGSGELGNGNGPPPSGFCTTDDDCSDDLRCNQGVCEEPPPPNCNETGCPEGFFCDTDGACKGSGEKPCTSNDDCGEGFHCAESTGFCMESCLVNTDCPSGLSCNTDLGYCVECTFDSDCTDSDRSYCLSEEGRCVECMASNHCPNNFFCDLDEISNQRYSCREGCLDGNDCTPGTRCNRSGEAPGTCVECTPQTATQDCADGSRQRCHPHLLQCVQCLDHHQCNVGVMKKCHPEDWVCVECLEHEDCPKGRVCLNTESRCKPGCTDDNRCPPIGEPDLIFCDSARGLYGECIECMYDDHCEPGYKCDDGSCVEGCNNDDNCPEHRPKCNLIQNKCIECLNDDDCGEHLICDSFENACKCKEYGDACSASAECGNPQGWPDVPWWDGTCIESIWCLAEVKCEDVASAPWQPISGGRCGDTCSIPDRQSSCPSGFCCRRARNAEGSTGLKCVATGLCATACRD